MNLLHPLTRQGRAALSARPVLRIESLALLLSLWFTAACNLPFWRATLTGHDLLQLSGIGYAVAVGVLLSATHFVMLLAMASVLPRPLIRPGFALLALTTAGAAYWMQHYHVYLDPGMIRNVLHTDTREASELLTWSMLPALAIYGVPPLLLIARSVVHAPATGTAAFARRTAIRLAALLAGILAGGVALLGSYQDLSSLLRTHKEVRYLITPANYLYGLGSTLSDRMAPEAAMSRVAVGTDVQLGAGWQKRNKPVLMLVVVGETARAANWGLSGYARQTTPRLTALDIINFPQVTACGTSTEVSLPCMLSPYGRAHYDEDRIRHSEALPDVLQRAGFRVTWLDNQSGCKGTCEGVGSWKPSATTLPQDCSDSGCFDNALLDGTRSLITGTAQNTVLFLHMLGNHGPAYSRRYPDGFRQFTPTCDRADLTQCTQQEIINAYDNVLLYTDYLLAEAVELLKNEQERYDTALVYVSDHGESLGEYGLYLHGIPYAIAPREQKEVPMVMWMSGNYAHDFAVDTDCLRRRSSRPASHDNLFHTVLGLLDLDTRARDGDLDLSAPCRAA